MRAKRDQPRKPSLAPAPPAEPKARPIPSGNRALSLWSSPKQFALAERLRKRHGASFSEIVWTLAEALDAGLITIDINPRVKASLRAPSA